MENRLFRLLISRCVTASFVMLWASLEWRVCDGDVVRDRLIVLVMVAVFEIGVIVLKMGRLCL